MEKIEHRASCMAITLLPCGHCIELLLYVISILNWTATTYARFIGLDCRFVG